MSGLSGYYVKRPLPVCVIETESSDQLHGFTAIVWRKTRIDGGEVYNQLHDSWIGFKFGDMLNVTTPGDIYPIERSVFENTYVREELL